MNRSPLILFLGLSLWSPFYFFLTFMGGYSINFINQTSSIPITAAYIFPIFILYYIRKINSQPTNILYKFFSIICIYMALIAIYWFFSKSSVSYMLAAMQMFTLSTVFYFGYILNTNEEIEITRFAAVINILLLLLFIAFGVQSVSCPNQGCEYFMFANGYILGYTLYQTLDYLPITLSIFIMFHCNYFSTI